MNGSHPDHSNDARDPATAREQSSEVMTGRQVYNVVSDTVTGANLRLKDNVFQAVSIAVCLVLGALLGLAWRQDRILGVVVGAFAGLLVGLFGSGIFLMIWRAAMHLRGRHD